MQLNYSQKNNGQYILNRYDIDEIATMFLKEYVPMSLQTPQTVNIEAIVQDCYGLDIQIKTLNMQGSVLGLITFEDTQIKCLDMMYKPIEEVVPQGTIVVSSGLIGRDSVPRRRFLTEQSKYG